MPRRKQAGGGHSSDGESDGVGSPRPPHSQPHSQPHSSTETSSPPRARGAVRTNSTNGSFAASLRADAADSAEGEIEQLRTRIADLLEETKHQNLIIHSIHDQNWTYLADRARKIKAHFSREMDELIGDIDALLSHSARQKESVAHFTPARSRSNSAATAPAASLEAAREHTTALVSLRSGPTTSAPPPSSQSRNNADGTPLRSAVSSKVKEFTWRDSTLNVLFRSSPEISTIYNILTAVLILFAAKVWISDLFTVHDKSDADLSLSVLTTAFAKLYYVVPIWLAMFVFHSLILPVMWLWRCEHLSDRVYTGLYVLHQIVFIFGFARIIIHFDLPIASSLILLCEQVRMTMLTHSFWRETLRIKHSPSETPKGVNPHLSTSERNSTLLPTFREQASQFYLFHFAPTLIYRNSYPRTRYIRWPFVARCFAECVGCIAYTYIIFASFCVPEFRSTAANPGDFKALSVSLFNSVLPGITVYLLTFFGLLHCWMNMFAELTRFADRLFYADWWNTTSFSSYYRKWNMIVHDSLYNYIYIDLRALGAPNQLCFFATFIVSAIVHEYIIAVAMKFFYPVLLVMFSVFGVAFVYLTRCIGTDSRIWNVFFWTNLIVGNGILLIMYSREFYARQRVGDSDSYHFDTQSWVPYSWQPFIDAYKRAQ